MKLIIMNNFSKLDPNAPIFGALQSSSLFQKLKEDKELYIEVRKDNYLNVYYQGGCVAKIDYKDGLVFTTHNKYLGIGESGYTLSENFLESDLESVKKRVKEKYSQKKYLESNKTEDLSEKFYQADLILRKYAVVHLDSEFAYNKDDKQRIDIVCCNEDGEVSFVELKIIGDGRLSGSMEVLDQMDKYIGFIRKYEFDLLDHYQKVYDVKKQLGLPRPPCRPASIVRKPILLVLNNYTKIEHKRKAKIENFKNACVESSFALIWSNDQGEEITV